MDSGTICEPIDPMTAGPNTKFALDVTLTPETAGKLRRIRDQFLGSQVGDSRAAAEIARTNNSTLWRGTIDIPTIVSQILDTAGVPRMSNPHSTMSTTPHVFPSRG